LGVETTVQYCFASRSSVVSEVQRLTEFLGAALSGGFAGTGKDAPWSVIEDRLLNGERIDDVLTKWTGPFRKYASIERDVQLLKTLTANENLLMMLSAKGLWSTRLCQDAGDISASFGVLPCNLSVTVAETEQFRDNLDGTYSYFGRSGWHVTLSGYGSPIDPPAWEEWYFNLAAMKEMEAKLHEIDPAFVRYWEVIV